MKKIFLLLSITVLVYAHSAAQLKTATYHQWKQVHLGKQLFELHNVKGEVIKFQGRDVIKIERDLQAIPFDSTNIERTVDEPHFAKLVGLDDFENGTIEVMLYSQIQEPKPYSGVAGFIGIFYKVAPNDKAFEAIYLRPKVGRVTNQRFRNHSVQYIAYPDYKFDTLRKIAPFRYEGSAPIALNEWIKMRIEVNGTIAEMFINDAKYSNFIVDIPLGKQKLGSIGLYVDIGTIGYFRDLKVTKRKLKLSTINSDSVNKL